MNKQRLTPCPICAAPQAGVPFCPVHGRKQPAKRKPRAYSKQGTPEADAYYASLRSRLDTTGLTAEEVAAAKARSWAQAQTMKIRGE